MVAALVLLAILFLLGFFNSLFHIPPKKLLAYLQPLFPCVAFLPITSTKSPSSTPKEDCKDKNKATGITISTSITARDKELETVFATFDKNGDGYITRQELAESLRNIGLRSTEKEVDVMIEKLDVNGDGLIDLEEFCKMYKSIGRREKYSMDEEEEVDEEMELRDAFDVFDWDKDGLITVVELSSVLASLGMKRGISVEDCKEMINKVDMDGDGMVDFEEFKHMMNNGANLVSIP